MTDYNDGNWHGWNGGECPVHPETEVDTWDAGCDELFCGYIAGDLDWSTGGCFRVTKEYRETREFWVNEYNSGLGGAHETKEDAKKYACSDLIRCIHVREVI